MAADLHLHIKTDELSDEDLTLFMQPSHTYHFDERDDPIKKAYDAVAKTPDVWIGEVSWLKADLFGDENYIPETVERVAELVGEGCVIDDDLIRGVEAAFELPRSRKNSYRIAKVDEVVTFLSEHKGAHVFQVSW